MIGPTMLIIADQRAIWISRQCRLSSPRETKEQCHISILPFIHRRMQCENIIFYRHKITHDCKDSLLHLPRILSTKDNHLLTF